MQTPPRLDRVLVENRLGRPKLSDRQREREERIIAGTRILMSASGTDPVTLRRIALSLRMTTTSIRRYFIDVETILAEILLRHLIAIYRAISQVPQDAPNRAALQRNAYLEATRHPWGGFTESHLLLIRRRHSLPEDLAKPVEDMRQVIGEALGGDHAETAFTLLDAPQLQPAEIEAMLAAYAGARQGAAPTAELAPAHRTQPAAPPPKPAQPQPTAQPGRTHRERKAARRQRLLMARAARAARACAQAPPPTAGP